jgi:hypothetical protein
MDVALTPVAEDDIEKLELFHTPSAEEYVAKTVAR